MMTRETDTSHELKLLKNSALASSALRHCTPWPSFSSFSSLAFFSSCTFFLSLSRPLRVQTPSGPPQPSIVARCVRTSFFLGLGSSSLASVVSSAEESSLEAASDSAEKFREEELMQYLEKKMF